MNLRQKYVRRLMTLARHESGRRDTDRWIRQHVTSSPGPLFMRADGDGRKDAVVKRELFDKHVRHEYNVVAVLDDRQQVVDMWRSLGLTCLQVAPGDF